MPSPEVPIGYAWLRVANALLRSRRDRRPQRIRACKVEARGWQARSRDSLGRVRATRVRRQCVHGRVHPGGTWREVDGHDMIFRLCQGAFCDDAWFRSSTTLIPNGSRRARYIDFGGDWWWDDRALFFLDREELSHHAVHQRGRRLAVTHPTTIGRRHESEVGGPECASTTRRDDSAEVTCQPRERDDATLSIEVQLHAGDLG